VTAAAGEKLGQRGLLRSAYMGHTIILPIQFVEVPVERHAAAYPATTAPTERETPSVMKIYSEIVILVNHFFYGPHKQSALITRK
jgi:hypothetical protein